MSNFSQMSRFPGYARSLFVLSAVLLLSVAGVTPLRAAGGEAAARAALPQVQRALPAGATDAGVLPGSQTIGSIAIELKRTPAQQADLDGFLTAVQTTGSADYRKWMTTAGFAARFAPTSDAVGPVTAWLATQGLQVQSVSAGGMRLVVSGTAQQVSAAFGVELHRLAMAGGDGVLVSGTLSVPSALAGSIRAVSGIAAVPGVTDGVVGLASAVDLNATAVLSVDLANAESVEELTDVLEQASAQGQSVLVLHADPAAVPVRALSLVVAGSAATVASPNNVTPRPDWQVATGLPGDALRATPDAAVATDATALAAALQGVVTKAGVRQGEVAATFYKLAPETGIFTHADSSLGVDSWSSTDGLGAVNVAALAKAWPAGATPPLNAKLVNSSEVITHGGSLTITVTITGGSGTPTGTVTFASAQGGTLSTGTLNASGVATFTTTTLAGGQYGFYGTYNGDSTYTTATSNVDTVTVNPEAATVVGSVPATAVGVGGTIPVTVTVSAPSGVGTPSGTVTVTPNGTAISMSSYTGTLVASTTAGTATATVSVPATNVGSFTFQVNCTTSASFSCYSPTSFAVTEVKGTPVAVLAAPSNSSATATTLTATVMAATAAAGVVAPTGTVQFLDGTTALGSSALTAGAATYTGALAAASQRKITPDATVTHTLTAVYSGDTNYAAVTSAAVADATAATLIATTTSLTSSGTTGAYGSTFTLTSAVAVSSVSTAEATPTGTITITDAGTTVGSGTLAAGTASITLSTLALGSHTLTATYSGDSVYAGSSSTTTVTITVTPVTGVITATLSPTGTVPYGYDATLSITVTLASGANPPPGTVTATISGGNGSYMGSLSGTTGTAVGTASIDFPVPSPGTYTISITCNATVVCSTVTKSITTTKGFTTTTLLVTPTTPQVGVPTTVSATVANSGTGTGTYTYTGTVSFYSGGTFLGSAVLSGGVATRTVVLTTTSLQSLTAVYGGDTNWSGSTSAADAVSPTPLDANIVVTANATTGVVGQNIILTATLTPSVTGSTLIPSGTITFYDTINGTVVVLGSAPLVSNTLTASYATFSTTGLVAGTHSITAVYTGDSDFLKETSVALAVNIGDFSVTFVPSSLQISAGGSGQTTAVVSAINTFSGTVALGCTPAPNSLTTCSVSPATVTVGASAVVTVTTTSAKTSSRVGAVAASSRVLGAVAVGGLFSLCFVRRRRIAALLVLLCAVLVMSGGCGLGSVDATNNTSSGSGSGSGGTTTSGTPPGTYSFTITGASVNAAVNVSHLFTLPVTVQ